jgi:hypothetical protein
MLRLRFLRPRWLAVTLVAWGIVWAALPAPVEGAPLPPRPSATAAPGAEGALAPELRTARLALVAQGLAPGDADRLLARLSPAERAELAARAGELAAGGDATLLIVAIALLIAAILLYLPMAGRMEGWWQ